MRRIGFGRPSPCSASLRMCSHRTPGIASRRRSPTSPRSTTIPAVGPDAEYVEALDRSPCQGHGAVASGLRRAAPRHGS